MEGGGTPAEEQASHKVREGSSQPSPCYITKLRLSSPYPPSKSRSRIAPKPCQHPRLHEVCSHALPHAIFSSHTQVYLCALLHPSSAIQSSLTARSSHEPCLGPFVSRIPSRHRTSHCRISPYPTSPRPISRVVTLHRSGYILQLISH